MGKRRITIEDLLSLKWVSDPQVSPDGTRVAYVLTIVDREADTYRSHLWVMPLEGGPSAELRAGPARQFTVGDHRDSNPRWSPDGRWIAFLSDRGTGKPERGAKRPKQICLIPSDGGEAVQLTTGTLNPSDFLWSPDGQTIAFVGKSETQTEEKTDVKVITRVRYKHDGEGFWDGRYKHIFTIPVQGGKARQLTSGDFDHVDPVWAPDGRYIAFVANRTPEADFTHVTDIWVIPSDGGDPKYLTRSVGPMATPAWSLDGRYIACYGHENAHMGATNINLWMVPVDGSPSTELRTGPSTGLGAGPSAEPRAGEPVNLTTAYDRSLTHHILTDMRAHPKVGGPVWSPDGKRVYVLIAEGGTNQLGAVETGTGSVTVLTSARREIYGYSLNRAATVAVIAASDPVTPGDLWMLRLDGDSVRERRLTELNHPLLDDVALSMPERFSFEGAGGWPVEGWVLRPAEFRKDVKYPAVLQIHGGPHGAYGEAFFHEFQLLAAEGLVVVYTNPRGSQGYGQRFTAATHHDWGGKDYEDLMRGLDAAMVRFPFIDPERVGVTGGSYGGFMTNWVIGHTDRFKAAVTMRSISNHLSQWGTSDLAFMKGFWEFPGDPWEAPTWYWERSPLAYVTQITTPLLILHSEQDLRCPVGEAEQLFAALKKLRREVTFVRFSDESHDLSRNGKPTHRVERLRWIVRWFVEHLMQHPQAVREAAVAGGSTE